MENLVRIIKAIDYIEDNLKEEISLKAMAERSCLSEYHFHRLFHLVVGDSPGNYLRKRRLYQAALQLGESQQKVIDIAMDWGYGSPEAFSRAFSRHFGISPLEYKNRKVALITYPKPALTLQNLNHIHKGVSMKPEMVKREEIKLIGPVFYGEDQGNNVAQFWQRHFHIIEDLPNRKDENCYGFCFHTSDYLDRGMFHYMPAIEVKDFNTIPMGAVAKTVPPHEYAKFTHRGDAEKLGDTYQYILGTWFPNKDYEQEMSFSFEYYREDSHGNDLIEIFIPVVKKG